MADPMAITTKLTAKGVDLHILSLGLDTSTATGKLKLVESAIPPLKEGQILLQTLWMSVDPYMRGHMDEGESMRPGSTR